MATALPEPLARFAENGRITPRTVRRFLIDMSLRRQKPGTGSSHEFMLRRTADIEWPDLRVVLAEFDWAIVGGVATRAFMPERMTKDLDVLVREADQQAVLDALTDADYEVVKPLSIGGAMIRSPDGVEIDVLFGRQVWLDEAFSTLTHDPAGYPVLDLPYLVLMKLESSRAVDYGDVTKMLGWNDDDVVDRVRDAVRRYSPDDSSDLESMIYLGRLERELPDE